MVFLDNLPFWALALAIFFLRIIDVGVGTMRTIMIVQGRVRLSVVLGFFEVLVWVTAVGHVIVHMKSQPYLILPYAAGFATGNAVGILLEKKLALGSVEIRLISLEAGDRVAEAIRDLGQAVTTFRGEGRGGPRTLLYIVCPRKRLQALLQVARRIDPEVKYVVDRVSESSHFIPLPHATGWRSVLKKK